MLILFTLVTARVGGLFLGAPLFSIKVFPQRFKVVLILALAAANLPGLPSTDLPEGAYAVVIAMGSELAIGFAIGLLARLFLLAFQMAGALISFQMGFAMARTFDSMSGASAPVVATMLVQLMTILFILMDGHHLLIRSVAGSYEAFPIGAPLATGALNSSLFSAGQVMYESGARIAGPVTGLMLLINSLMGFLNRIVPQLGIFSIGFVLMVMGGLISLTMALPEMVAFFFRYYEVFEAQLVELLSG